ncbi:G-protein coupled receptor 183-like [Sinocyclocheilus rhinocerous]|uniref:G-protein coupled receptor 183-like n=1 Tax=Sinocyclocheilus rhinocerous TaxID=307959 RepID=UPI0007B7EDE0|nr:PREDICTED: G-protein coupled receptor 183-like [Sinocyclocheilus rhinocerous]XP_016408959.1 PREDICTED: G-protein coupled receptor 183-like [Sinocyclocheilus rhinocerous]
MTDQTPQQTMPVNDSSTNQTCDVFIYKESARIIFPIFYCLILVISVAGNSLVLCITCQKKQKMNSTTIYIINLAISDTLFTLALPGRITYYIRGFDWPFGDFLCRLTAMIFYSNTYASIAFMTCISVDRYLAMLHRQRCQRLRKAKVVRGICILVWVVVLLETSPLLLKNTMEYRSSHRTCMEFSNFDSHWMAFVLLFACIIGFCFPLGLILCCYSRVSSKLSKTAKENPVTNRSGSNGRAKNMILLILLSFVVCFSPYHINIMQFAVRRLYNVPSCEDLKTLKMSLQVTVSMMNFNSCLDPIIYFFAIKTYKQRVMSLFKSYISISASSRSMQENSSSNT